MKTQITLLLLLATTILFSQTKLDHKIYQYFNGTNWVDSSKTEYQYNANNKLDNTIDLTWDAPIANQWNNNYKEMVSYDANNNINETIEQIWNATSNQWDNDYKTNITFNANDNPYLVIGYNWNNGQWNNDFKIDVTYVSALVINQVISYNWDTNSNQWLEETKTNYNYNANNKIDTVISEEYDGTQYDLSDKTIYAYDANDMISEIIYQYRDGGQWVNSDKTTYQVDTNANRVSEISFDFATSWSYNTKIEYTYNTSLLMANIANPFNQSEIEYKLGFENNPFTNKILHQTNYSYATGAWSGNDKTTYYYVNTASVNNANVTNVSIYPNPTTNIVNVNFNDTSFNIKQINIYDVLGKKVLQTSNKQINIQHLEKGVYNIEITSTKGNLIRKKIIKN